MTDFLDEKRDEIDGRLAELRPLVEEYNRLQAAASALAKLDGSDAAVVAPAPLRPAEFPRGNGRDAGAGESAGGAGGEDPGVGGDSRIGGDSDVSADSAAGGDSPDGAEAAGGAVADPGNSRARELTAAPLRRNPTARRVGRPKGSGMRAAEALRIVREQPGVTIPELADRMGIKQNYLYRVLPELVQEGKVVKQGRGWHPHAA